MNSVGFNEGAVLWIDPAVQSVPELPDGFAFLVQDLLGWSDPGHAVWARGLLLDGGGTPVQWLTLCVPTNQPRAVPATRVPPHPPTMNRDGVAAIEHASHRAGDDPGLVGPPPGYQRRVFQ
jgi:hypothetical protein